MAYRLAAGVSYLYVHGEDLIRARDVNLPQPTEYSYPLYDDSGTTFLNTYYPVDSFSTWEMTRTISCPFPPCINPVSRPVPALGAVNQFDSAASSVYHGLTVSVRRRMTSGLYFRLGYTWAHAVDDGQDALVAGRPATVQILFDRFRARPEFDRPASPAGVLLDCRTATLWARSRVSRHPVQQLEIFRRCDLRNGTSG